MPTTQADALAPPQPPGSRFRPHPESVRDEALRLLATGQSASAVARNLGLRRSSVRNWLRRPVSAVRHNQLARVAVDAESQRRASLLAEVVRDSLGSVLAHQSKMLADSPAQSVDELRTTPERQGLAAVLKTVAEAAGAILGEGFAAPTPQADKRIFDSVIDVEEINPVPESPK